MKNIAYTTKYGKTILNDSREALKELDESSVDLVITSPPFALLRTKEYGNESQEEYVEWLMSFAREVYRVLKPTGSFVIDLGGAYQRGKPVRSLYNFEVLLRFCKELDFHLAEEFYWFNPSKLPSPIEWVNKRKIRAKDSVNTLWWFSKTEYPKADVKKVLTPYSERMQKLLATKEKYYTPKMRPSGHNISDKFSSDNGGAIPSNLLQIPNSESNSMYLRTCKDLEVKAHPARFPAKLPKFFIDYLTDEGDLVVDIFAGSNTTGQVAEESKRRWISIDNDPSYVSASVFRFIASSNTKEKRNIYDAIAKGKTVDIASLEPEHLPTE